MPVAESNLIHRKPTDVSGNLLSKLVEMSGDAHKSLGPHLSAVREQETVTLAVAPVCSSALRG